MCARGAIGSREGGRSIPVLIFVGTIIDTIKGELRLPADKLRRLMGEVEELLEKKWCTRRELESLIGTLQHACSVIRPGRSLLRRATALLSVAKKPRHHIRLNKKFKSDMMWWKVFGQHWNGISVLIEDCLPEVTVTSDASDSWGSGCIIVSAQMG